MVTNLNGGHFKGESSILGIPILNPLGLPHRYMYAEKFHKKQTLLHVSLNISATRPPFKNL